MKRLLIIATRLLAVVLLCTSQAVFAEDDSKSDGLNIEAQPLASALREFSEQTGLQIGYAAELADGKRTRGVEGVDDPEVALDTLLASTGLEHRFVNDETVVIRAPSTDEVGGGNTKPGKSQPASSPVLMAQNQTSAVQSQTSNPSDTTNEDDEVPHLEEILVIGTNIRGVENSASPLLVFDRQDIADTGASTIQGFIRTLPQNFAGGPAETNSGGIISNVNGATDNFAGGSSINLRGLGAGSTLVLLDGQRLAPAGFGSFVDISMIPLVAIERVEVLIDGSSAIYGSDAVAGTVNFVLREGFEGAETLLRYGVASGDTANEVQFGQLFGTKWQSGSAMISYEYFDSDPLVTSDRSFSESAPDPYDLIGAQERNSVFLKARQNLTNRFELFGSAYYSKRDNNTRHTSVVFGGGTQSRRLISETEQSGAVLGLDVELSDTWAGEFVGSLSQHSAFFDELLDGSTTATRVQDTESTVTSITAKADGSLFHIGGGDVRAAIGGAYLNDDYENLTTINSSLAFVENPDRDIVAIFGEVMVPFVSEENRVTGIERLDLSLAWRYEDFSDFGSTSNPKFGLLWSPIEGLNVRSTYGTSFRAPLLSQMDERRQNGFSFNVPDNLSPTGTSDTMFFQGSNAGLQPEESTAWTFGLDIQPPSASDLSIGLSYFNIEYDGRIETPAISFEMLNDPQFLPIIDRNPDPALLAYIGALPPYFNFTPTAPEDQPVLVDARIQNISTVKISGVDVQFDYKLKSDLGLWNFSLNSTYLFEYENTFGGGTPTDIVNTVYNPIDLKIRGGIAWSRGGFAANLSLNYTDSYDDIRDFVAGAGPIVEIDSWTTADLNLVYSTEESAEGFWGGTKFSLLMSNLFDEDPPLVTSFFGSNQINYDHSNASPLGRFVSFQVTKQW